NMRCPPYMGHKTIIIFHFEVLSLIY
ncbi:hypothetical protein DE07_22380, partial [Salmonella enterica subsp. enterica serovar Heidelberg]